MRYLMARPDHCNLLALPTLFATLAISALASTAQAQVTLFDNGPLSSGATSKSGIAAPAGTSWSELQNDNGNGTESNGSIGFAVNQDATGGSVPTGGFRLADNFTIPPGQPWAITSIWTYGFKVGAPINPSPFDNCHLQIWNGRPGDRGSAVIFGDMAVNRLVGSSDAAIYRIYNTIAPAPGIATETTRRIWRNEISTKSAITAGIPLVLSAGTYWIDFQASDNTNSTQHFAPSVVAAGARTLPGWNGRQFRGAAPGAWADLVDIGNPNAADDVPQDLPFQVRGTLTASSPCTQPLTGCSADIAPPGGGNGKIDTDDLLAVINSWGIDTYPNGPRPQGDIAPPPNGNCKVNTDDLLAVVNHWGVCP